ncbi:MAG TPA: hypothetical protein VL134_08380 [Leptolyngbya sp.]|jgi:hypothetical protein|nr:hypothetical protein [Leptolyngbya sp.]
MLIGVIVLNLLLASYGFYLTWQIRNLHRSLAQAAEALILAEQNARYLLSGAPSSLERRELRIRQARKLYRQLDPKLQQAEKALALLGIGRSMFFNSTLAQRLKKSATNRKSR